MVKQIAITQGKHVLIDDEDFDSISHHKWYHNNGYAQRPVFCNGERFTQYMHRQIMGNPEGFDVDHINGKRLDNRRTNLRLVTRSQNLQNVHSARVDSGTGVRNVYRRGNRYDVRIWINGRGMRFGSYPTLEEAALVASDVRRKYMSHSPENWTPEECD